MRIIYIDIDSLRLDHLRCYGYQRHTSPNIDLIAERGVRSTNCYASDVPCLPSRTALFGGRFGIHNGVINHGGVASEPFTDGNKREFRSTVGSTNWMSCLRTLGYRTASISSFAERHSAFHFYAGFNDIINPGQCGIEPAEDVSPLAIEWIAKHGRAENWFLHVNFWDPHTPYRARTSTSRCSAISRCPDGSTNASAPPTGTTAARTAQEVMGFGNAWEWEYAPRWPKQPVQIDSMDKVRMMFDGYDAGVRVADEHIGR